MLVIPEQVVQQLKEMPTEKRFIFAHPNYESYHTVLSNFFDQAIYVRFEGVDLRLESLRAQIDAASAEQAGATDGAGKKGILVLDECDRAQQAALGALLRDFSDFDGRVILCGRTLPTEVLMDDGIRSQIGFVPTDPQWMLWDYAQPGTSLLLEVRAFGEGRVHLNGKQILNWDGALPRALFFYLVDRGMATRAEIFETFWPNLTTREATNVFHVTKRKISEVLGVELTVYGSSFYHISPKIQLSYDVALFNELMQDSDLDAGEGEKLRQAVALYRGDYLNSASLAWVVNRRVSLRQANCDALVMLGKIHENKSQPREALGLLLRASSLTPEREDIALSVMRLYRDLDMRDSARIVYQRLAKALRDQLNVAPSPQVQQLAAEIG